jgi:pleiotropic regulator 1
MFVTDTTSSIKKWKFPDGNFVFNFSGHEAIINTLAVNEEGVMFSGADNGTITLWDYKTGLPFQHLKDIPQPGSLDAEAVSTGEVRGGGRDGESGQP